MIGSLLEMTFYGFSRQISARIKAKMSGSLLVFRAFDWFAPFMGARGLVSFNHCNNIYINILKVSQALRGSLTTDSSVLR